jgi:hypothetical protein
LLGKDVIHSVANPLRVLTGAIHIYGGDLFGTPRSDWDPETFEERPFDVEGARKVFADANERWSCPCDTSKHGETSKQGARGPNLVRNPDATALPTLSQRAEQRVRRDEVCG